MRNFKQIILPVLVATIWIILSEFIRNEFLLKACWTNHFTSLGMVFPSGTVNGAVWGLWSMAFAAAIFIVSGECSDCQCLFNSILHYGL